MKQLLFIHGGDSLKPGEDFFAHWESDAAWEVGDPFAAREKKKKRWKDDLVDKLGHEWVCAFPKMPNDMDAHYNQWKWWFEKHTPFAEAGIVLVGHSLGASFLMRYLATESFPVSIAQLHLIATPMSEGDFIIPDDLSRVETQVQKIYLYHSIDDEVVPFAASEHYAQKLPGAVFMRFTDRNHFFAQEEFPELVSNIFRG